MRHVIVVDTETSGLDLDTQQVVEVAWHDITDNTTGSFIPLHDVRKLLATAEFPALRINRYIDRIAAAEQDRSVTQVKALAELLHGNTLAGCNPTFDAAFLTKMFRHFKGSGYDVQIPQWHHRLLDLSAYAAGALGLPFDGLPGLNVVCDKLGVVNRAPHTAEGDVAATVECFHRLHDLCGEVIYV